MEDNRPEEREPEDDSIDWTATLKEEALWILQTLASITLSLIVGRILTLLTRSGGIDLNLTQGDWQKSVDAALAAKERPPDGGTFH